MKIRIASIVAVTVASGLLQSSYAVCLDDNYVSGYHVSLEKELRTAQAVAVGTVISAKAVPPPYRDLDEGTVYRVKIDEILRGRTKNTIDLFSENNSGRFWMEAGHRYLIFVSKDRDILYVNSCGNSGELPASLKTLEAVRNEVRK